MSELGRRTLQPSTPSSTKTNLNDLVVDYFDVYTLSKTFEKKLKELQENIDKEISSRGLSTWVTPDGIKYSIIAVDDKPIVDGDALYPVIEDLGIPFIDIYKLEVDPNKLVKQMQEGNISQTLVESATRYGGGYTRHSPPRKVGQEIVEDFYVGIPADSGINIGGTV